MNHDFLLEQRANDESWKDVIIRTMARVVRGTSTKTLRIITDFSYYLRSSLSNKFPDIDSSKKHSFDYSFTRALPSRESFRIGHMVINSRPKICLLCLLPPKSDSRFIHKNQKKRNANIFTKRDAIRVNSEPIARSTFNWSVHTWWILQMIEGWLRSVDENKWVKKKKRKEKEGDEAENKYTKGELKETRWSCCNHDRAFFFFRLYLRAR